jgi:hypothetical protein
MKVEEAASASAGARRSLPLRVRAQVVHGLVAFKGARSVLLSCPGGLSSLLLFPAALRFLEARRRPHGVLVQYAIRARELSLSPLFSSWKFRQELSGCFLSGGNQCNGQCRELESPFGGAVCGSYDNEEGL